MTGRVFDFPGATVALLTFNSTHRHGIGINFRFPFLQWRGDGRLCSQRFGWECVLMSIVSITCMDTSSTFYITLWNMDGFPHFYRYEPFINIWKDSLFKVCRDPHALKNSAYQKGADAESDRQTYALECFFLEYWLSLGGVLRNCFLTSA